MGEKKIPNEEPNGFRGVMKNKAEK